MKKFCCGLLSPPAEGGENEISYVFILRFFSIETGNISLLLLFLNIFCLANFIESLFFATLLTLNMKNERPLFT